MPESQRHEKRVGLHSAVFQKSALQPNGLCLAPSRNYPRSAKVRLALYTDWKNVYKREPTEKELLAGVVPVTQFGRMCERLGIRIIAANSAQAKGRVERSHGTHLDRLIKKMRRKKIRTHEEANVFLKEYLVDHNRR